jgi:hypothetical protein
MSAQQSASFCFMPPESLPAGLSGKGSSPVAFRSSAIRASRSASPCPKSRPKKSRFSKTLSVG